MNKKIVLASASPRRRELLQQIGWEPFIEPSGVDEVMTTQDPQQVVLELSALKALDVAKDRTEECYVIGADTVVAVDGEILGKPGSFEKAVEMLNLIQGRDHFVYTGVTLVRCSAGGEMIKTCSFAEKTQVSVALMDAEEIQAYVASGEPMDKAGGYGIQGLFAAFVTGIEGDYNNVVGLPVGRVYREIKKMEKEIGQND